MTSVLSVSASRVLSAPTSARPALPSQCDNVVALPLLATGRPSNYHLPNVSGLSSTAVRAKSGGSQTAERGASTAQQPKREPANISAPATVFVAGATGATGQKIVKALLDKGIRVKAGVRSVKSGREKLGPQEDALELTQADVTGNVDALAAAIKGSDAVVSALGARPSFDFSQPWKVDYQGTVNLVDACKKAGVKKLVIVSALLTNGVAKGQFLNPAFLILNAFGLALVAKHRAEQYIWSSGLDYTILRPGGLDRGPTGGNLVAGDEDTIFGGSVERQQVAEAAAEALLHKEASYKVVELISKDKAPAKSFKDLFASVTSVQH